MPSTTPKMRRYMGADLRRKRMGMRTKTHMSEAQLEEFASHVVKKTRRKKP